MNSFFWAIAPVYLIDPKGGRKGWVAMAHGGMGQIAPLCTHNHKTPHGAMLCSEARLYFEQQAKFYTTNNPLQDQIANAASQEQIDSLKRCLDLPVDGFPASEI
jgi:hypothetical protein